MYTINQGLNGGWYGHITADDPETAYEAARALASVLTRLRASDPKPAREASRERPALTPAGEACLAFCEDYPRSTHAEYTAAGHTLRTVKWLVQHGFLLSRDGEWIVNRNGDIGT